MPVSGCKVPNVDVDKISVPIKLVVTDDSDVITEVIKATNRQTAVLPERWS